MASTKRPGVWHGLQQRLQRQLHNRPLLLTLTYVALIVYASLYSAQAWRDNGGSLFDFLGDAWPRYWTWQDVLFNVLAYLPLGFLLGLAPRHRRWPWQRLLLPTLLGFGLSLTMEALQNFIPGRVPALSDLFFNTLGGLLGATLALFCGPALLLRLHRLGQGLGIGGLRTDPGTESGLILVGLWLFAQISPETLFFGLGDLRSVLSLPPLLPFQPELHSHLATLIAALQTLVVGLMLGAVLQRLHLSRRALFVLMLLLLAGGAGIRLVASWLLLGNAPAFSEAGRWAALTPGGLSGLALGLPCLLLALFLSPHRQLLIACMALVCAAVLVNLMPINPYSPAALTVWRQGHFLNFNGVTRFVAVLWPYLTLLFLVLADQRSEQRWRGL